MKKAWAAAILFFEDVVAMKLPVGVGLVYKAAGKTSFSYVEAAHAQARKAGQHLKICHGGTLDPFAAGLLLLLSGPATSLFSWLHALPKHYTATIRWGKETDSGDFLGKIVAEGSTADLKEDRLEEALLKFLGWTEQLPPAHSAKRVDGERAYEKVFRGEEVSLPRSRVYLHQAGWVEHRLPEQSILKICCRGGFYVRALARDLGQVLGCFGHLETLERTQIGPFSLVEGERWVGGLEAVSWCRRRELRDEEVGRLKRQEGIEQGRLLEPLWSAGDFKMVEPVVGIHRGKCAFLLCEEGEKLRSGGSLRGF
jgi:tRNA pseudouridine55 synthase